MKLWRKYHSNNCIFHSSFSFLTSNYLSFHFHPPLQEPNLLSISESKSFYLSSIIEVGSLLLLRVIEPFSVDCNCCDYCYCICANWLVDGIALSTFKAAAANVLDGVSPAAAAVNPPRGEVAYNAEGELYGWYPATLKASWKNSVESSFYKIYCYYCCYCCYLSIGENSYPGSYI